MSKPIEMYWWPGARRGAVLNFGDAISPMIVRMVAGRDVVYAPPRRAQLVALGSLLGHVREARWKRLLSRGPAPTAIWGTGSIARSDLGPSRLLRVGAVRGALTRDGLQLPAATPLGDPGLLIPRLVDGVGPKTHRWGIVPHYVDMALPIVTALRDANPGALLIDVTDPDPLATARRIASCDFIVASSLHAIITADAFGIPNVWAPWSDNVQGGKWKFNDYGSAIGRTFDANGPTHVVDLRTLEAGAECAEAQAVTRVAEGLVRAFHALGW